MKKALHWLPRLLAVFVTLFVSLFALDVFGEPGWFLGLLIHLIPTYFLMAFTVIAWKKPWIGGLLFIIGGLAFFAFTHFESAIICVPIIGIGAFFMADSYFFQKS